MCFATLVTMFYTFIHIWMYGRVSIGEPDLFIRGFETVTIFWGIFWVSNRVYRILKSPEKVHVTE